MSVLSILSITWKIKKLFSVLFQYFPYFLHRHHECSRFSLQREGRCQVYYSNAKQVVILQIGFLGCYYRPDRWVSRPTAWQGAPCSLMKSLSQNKASFAATCRRVPPSLRPRLCPVTHLPPWQHSNHCKTHSSYRRLCRCKPGWIPGLPQAGIIPSLNAHSIIPTEEMESRGESLQGHIQSLHFISPINRVEVGRLSYKVPIFLNWNKVKIYAQEQEEVHVSKDSFQRRWYIYEKLKKTSDLLEKMDWTQEKKKKTITPWLIKQGSRRRPDFHDVIFRFLLLFKDMYFWQQWDTGGLKCTWNASKLHLWSLGDMGSRGAQASRSQGVTGSQKHQCLVVIVVVEICKVGVRVGLASEMRVEVSVSFL